MAFQKVKKNRIKEENKDDPICMLTIMVKWVLSFRFKS